MSVINQMLKDLEQRQGSIVAGRYQPPAPSRFTWWRAWPVLALPLLAYGVLRLWSVLQPAALPVPQPVSAGVVATPAALSAAIATSSLLPSQSTASTPAHQASAIAQEKGQLATEPATSASGAQASLMASPSAGVALAAAERDSVLGEASSHGEPAEPAAAAAEEKALAQASDDALLGPDLYAEGASTQGQTLPPQNSLDIEELHLSAAQEAALERRKANQAIAKGQLEQARQALFRVLQQEPLDHGSRERLAGLLYGEERLQEARSLLEQGVALAPRYADFRLLLARVTLAMGDKSSALGYLNSLEPDVSRNLDYYATRAALAQEVGQYAAAAASYQQLSRAQPGEGRWWLGLAIAYDKQGRQLAAREAYQRAETASGLSAAAHNFARERRMQLEQG